MFFSRLFDTRRAATLLIAALIGVHVIHPIAADNLMPSYQHFAQPALQSLAGSTTVFLATDYGLTITAANATAYEAQSVFRLILTPASQ